MSGPRVEPGEGGGLVVRGMPPLLAWSLENLPRLLKDDAPGIRDRICPGPHADDDEANREWQRLNAPELAHLFEDARTLVVGDLSTLGLESDGFRIRIPAAHRSAWLSALAAARVAQGEAYGISAEDMEEAVESELRTGKDRAVLLIHLLGWMQGLLLDGPDPA